jgi:hypothetical protein
VLASTVNTSNKLFSRIKMYYYVWTVSLNDATSTVALIYIA